VLRACARCIWVFLSLSRAFAVFVRVHFGYFKGLHMDRYQRVEKPRVEEPIKENEIRITTQGKLRNYITYSLTMLQVRF
jgi:hypothetical protein